MISGTQSRYIRPPQPTLPPHHAPFYPTSVPTYPTSPPTYPTYHHQRHVHQPIPRHRPPDPVCRPRGGPAKRAQRRRGGSPGLCKRDTPLAEVPTDGRCTTPTPPATPTSRMPLALLSSPRLSKRSPRRVWKRPSPSRSTRPTRSRQ